VTRRARVLALSGAMADNDKIARVRGQLKSWVDNLPKWSTFPERYVRDYHAHLKALGEAGLDVSDFAISSDHARRIVASSNYITGEVHYADDLHVDRSTLLSRAGGLVSYLDEKLSPAAKFDARAYGGVTITGGNVTFGDGSNISITTVTVSDLLRALEAHVEKAVEDPEKRSTALTKVSDFLKHPALTTVLQTALPELLKYLPH